MFYKVKVTRTTVLDNGKEKQINEVYLTDALHFADAGYKVIQEVGTEAEVTDISLQKNLKPLVNEKTDENQKLFIVKIAEDCLMDDGSYKTIKYVLPAFAEDSIKLQEIMKDFISQGLEDMRLTTISETKWIYIA
jgi:hypothetical protein